MLLFILRFWPVLIPLVLYVVWYYVKGRKMTINGKPVERFRDGPWYWAVLASLLTGVSIFFVAGLDTKSVKGTHVPSKIENGKIVPAEIE